MTKREKKKKAKKTRTDPSWGTLTVSLELLDGHFSGFQPPLVLPAGASFLVQAIGVIAGCPAGQELNLAWDTGKGTLPIVLTKQSSGIPGNPDFPYTQYVAWQQMPPNDVFFSELPGVRPAFNQFKFQFTRVGITGRASASVLLWGWKLS